MSKKKSSPYTPEMEEYIIKEYKASPNKDTVNRLVEEIGKSSRSIIAKLSYMGVYETPVRRNKLGEKIVKKREFASRIGEYFGVDVPSLEKAERIDLNKLDKAIAARDREYKLKYHS